MFRKLFERKKNNTVQKQISEVKTKYAVFAPSGPNNKNRLLEEISTISDTPQFITLDDTVWQVKAQFILNGTPIDSLMQYLTEETEPDLSVSIEKLLKILPLLTYNLTATDVFTGEIIDLGNYKRFIVREGSYPLEFIWNFDKIEEELQKKVANCFIQLNDSNKFFNAKSIASNDYFNRWYIKFHVDLSNQHCDVYAIEDNIYLFVGRFKLVKQSQLDDTATVVQLGGV